MMPSSSATTTTITPTTTSYWCYSCTCFVSVCVAQDANADGVVLCPFCNGGFIEEIDDSSSAADAPATTPVSQVVRSVEDSRRSVVRRRRTSFNPVIVLHGGGANGERVDNEGGEGEGVSRDGRRAYEFYYDDGSGSGLRPLPDSVSEILMGSGFQRLLEQLSQIEASGNGIIGRSGNPPATKSAVESLPRVEIGDCHTKAEANCAVCMEVFEEGTEGREMPCKHIFHGDCIVPWLSIRNSCPVCRFELPSDPIRNEEENAVGMTIWRLPGGGFAVGRFTAGMREGERVLPVVLTEMDGGGLGSNEGPRRISWVRAHGTPEISRNGARSGNDGRLRRAARGMVSFMRRMRPNRGSFSSSSSSSHSSNLIGLDRDGESRVITRSSSLIRRFFI